MNKMKYTQLLLMLGSLTALTAQANLALNENLIENPGFETTTGWNGNVYQTTAKVHTGTYALYGGANAENTISQTVTLSDIDGFSMLDQANGNYTVEWGGWCASYISQDTSTLILEQLDSGGESLEITPVGGGYNWTEYAESTTLLPNTHSLRFSILTERNSGTNNDGYTDDVYMQVIPEPSSLALMLVAGCSTLYIRRHLRL